MGYFQFPRMNEVFKPRRVIESQTISQTLVKKEYRQKFLETKKFHKNCLQDFWKLLN